MNKIYRDADDVFFVVIVVTVVIDLVVAGVVFGNVFVSFDGFASFGSVVIDIDDFKR